MRLGLCIPRDAEFKLQQWGGIHSLTKPEHWINASSLAELDKEDEDMGTKFYHDEEVG